MIRNVQWCYFNISLFQHQNFGSRILWCMSKCTNRTYYKNAEEAIWHIVFKHARALQLWDEQRICFVICSRRTADSHPLLEELQSLYPWKKTYNYQLIEFATTNHVLVHWIYHMAVRIPKNTCKCLSANHVVLYTYSCLCSEIHKNIKDLLSPEVLLDHQQLNHGFQSSLPLSPQHCDLAQTAITILQQNKVLAP